MANSNYITLKTNSNMVLNIITTHCLDDMQLSQAKSLVSYCHTYDHSSKICFLESDLNVLSEFPCFYLAYAQDKLVGALSIFLPTESECEVYACTHPDYRKCGIFTALWTQAKEQLQQAHITDCYMVVDPLCPNDRHAVSSVGATYESTQYILRYDLTSHDNAQSINHMAASNHNQHSDYTAFSDVISSEAVSSEAVSSEAVSSEAVSSEAVSSDVISSDAVSTQEPNPSLPYPELELINESDKSNELYSYATFDSNDQLIGTCQVDIQGDCVTIFDFYIYEEYRSKRYGSTMLQLILKDLKIRQHHFVLLHVTSTNEPAYRLYTKQGFSIYSSIDYWTIPIS